MLCHWTPWAARRVVLKLEACITIVYNEIPIILEAGNRFDAYNCWILNATLSYPKSIWFCRFYASYIRISDNYIKALRNWVVRINGDHTCRWGKWDRQTWCRECLIRKVKLVSLCALWICVCWCYIITSCQNSLDWAYLRYW